MSILSTGQEAQLQPSPCGWNWRATPGIILSSSLVFLVLFSFAVAQVPRTINYQGRARGAGNAPVTGQHIMSLVLYDAPTGGNVLYAQNENVTFTNDGIFTVVIGGPTGGPIPETVRFDAPYWLGVTIAGINGGAELTPRYELRSAPYSFFSANADTARVLQIPAAITGFSELLPMIDVTNAGSIGLRAEGSKYGVVSNGPDSSSHWFVAGDNFGTSGAPVPGAHYRDNSAVAWGIIDRTGTLTDNFGIANISHNANNPGIYTVTLANNVELFPPGKNTAAGFAPCITPGGSVDSTALPIVASWSYLFSGSTASPNSFQVTLRDTQGRRTDQGFSVVVFGRPQ